jgi:plasmid stabilization system protein ParE
MAKFFLTRTATLHLYKIEEYSLQRWGKDRTKKYMEDLFCGFAQIAKSPEIGNLRKDQSFPFFMAPVEKHFAI